MGDWAEERAKRIWQDDLDGCQCDGCLHSVESIATALREAEARGKRAILDRLKKDLAAKGGLKVEPGYINSYETAIKVLADEAARSEAGGYIANASMKRAIVATLRAFRLWNRRPTNPEEQE